MVRAMHNGQKQSADAYSAHPGTLIDITPIVKGTNRGEANGFDLIDEAAELIRASEQRALHAEEKAEKVSAGSKGNSSAHRTDPSAGPPSRKARC